MRTEEEKAHSRLRTEMHNAFETNEIFSTPEGTLSKYLASLCTERVPNEEVRHREIIKALTINHIQMQRHIDKLSQETERLQKQSIQLQIQNNKLQKIVIWLAVVATVTTLIQISMLIWPPRFAPPTPIQEQNMSQAINYTPVSSPKEKAVHSQHAPKQSQSISETQNQDTLIKSDILLRSNNQDQTPYKTSYNKSNAADAKQRTAD